MSILSFGMGSSFFSGDNKLDNSSSPGIVRDSLIFHTDPGNTKSYDRVGISSTTTMYDISGFKRDITFSPNPPAFSTEGGGSLYFNGVDNYSYTTLFTGTKEYPNLVVSTSPSISVVVDMISNGTPNVVMNINSSNTNVKNAYRKLAIPGNAYNISGCSSATFNNTYDIVGFEEPDVGIATTARFKLSLKTLNNANVGIATTNPGNKGNHKVIPPNGLTVEFWFKPKRKTSPEYYQQIIGWRDGIRDAFYFLWRDDGTNATIDSEFRSQGIPFNDNISNWNVSSEFDKWNHVVLLSNKYLQRKLYVNGVERGNTVNGTETLDDIGAAYSLSSTIPANTTTPGTFYIGAPTNAWYYFGHMGTVRVYNRALTQSEITNNYNATKSRYGL